MLECLKHWPRSGVLDSDFELDSDSKVSKQAFLTIDDTTDITVS